MKRYIKSIVVSVITLQLLASCTDDYLQVKPKGLDLEGNYYRNQTEAYNGLVAVYDVVGWQGGGYVTKIGMANVASDDHYAGGGNAGDVSDYQVMSNYTLIPAQGPQDELWRKGFSGVFRANVLMAKLPDVPMDATLKTRYEAESKFLRAYFYFDLVRLFKNIPLFTAPVPGNAIYDPVQVPATDVYALIESDLKEAIAVLPPTVAKTTEAGRATKGAAQALLGKVYLQLERFGEAAALFQEVTGTPGGVSQYGYKLLPNFADLWKVDNKFNDESIFEISFTNTSAGVWDCVACTEGNVINIMSGPRGYKPLAAGAPDYVSGWSFFPVTQSLFDAIHFDPRNKATIANLDSLEANGIAEYEKGYMNTGYFMEKFAGRESNRWTGAGVSELNWPQNMYDMRLADIYLLEAEALLRGNGDLVRAQALFDAVRKRAHGGVESPRPLTFANIKLERRLELVGEGHRWFDLVRWGDAPTVLASKGFVAGRHEVLPIPLLELSNTKMEQNKEYGGTK